MPFSALESLDLSYNLLSSFPLRMGSLAHLHTLNLSRNRLWSFSALPESLTELNLAHNAIEKLAEHIQNLTRLRTLDLSRNPFANKQGTPSLFFFSVGC